MAYPEPLADRLYIETKKFLESHVSQVNSIIPSFVNTVFLVKELDKVKKAGEKNLLSSYHDR